ncbi:zingipain-1-like [Aphidius gifuensis]|uniref:zingipain-1-like n=1 Tax=Aphidius gifuensis TaxID=684658 RepID=UPI001CDD5931|nr:zingipain-1-like [Aphidius gifuensis]
MFFGGTTVVGLLLIVTTIQVESIDLELSCKKYSKDGICCQGQSNNCIIRTPTRNCFCDEYCSNKLRSDCCPDYKKYCHSEKSICIFEGVTYKAGESFSKSCNKCMCVKKEGKNAEITCEENDCLENLKKKSIHSIGTKDPEEWLSSVQEPLLVTDYGIPPPEEFDPRFDETRIVSPIRNQGQCGSSWAVSVADVISDRLSLQMNSNITLSAQQFIDCIDEEPQCAPGNPADAWNYATIAKLMSEERYPWTGLNDQCQVSTRQCQDENCHLNKLYSIDNVIHLSSHHIDLMYEILFKGSVQATMRVGKDFALYNSGIYKCPKNSSSIGYHSVRIVGWSETDDSEQYWIAANSWGTEWGENGYFKIAKGINECDIESYVLAD